MLITGKAQNIVPAVRTRAGVSEIPSAFLVAGLSMCSRQVRNWGWCVERHVSNRQRSDTQVTRDSTDTYTYTMVRSSHKQQYQRELRMRQTAIGTPALFLCSTCKHIPVPSPAKLAELGQQTPFAGLRSRHKEILLNNAECGPASDSTPYAKVLRQRKTRVRKRMVSIGQSTCGWACGTGCASKIVSYMP